MTVIPKMALSHLPRSSGGNPCGVTALAASTGILIGSRTNRPQIFFIFDDSLLITKPWLLSDVHEKIYGNPDFSCIVFAAESNKSLSQV